jgi:hypothetical protein
VNPSVDPMEFRVCGCKVILIPNYIERVMIDIISRCLHVGMYIDGDILCLLEY